MLAVFTFRTGLGRSEVVRLVSESSGSAIGRYEGAGERDVIGELTVDSAEVATVSVQVATANQTSGRQRGESRRPWGNSKNTRTGSKMVSSIGQTANQAAQSPPGSDPGAVSSAYWAYWLPAWVTATTRPKAPHSQPIGLRGCPCQPRQPACRHPYCRVRVHVRFPLPGS
jgi:hypothetical protein